MHFRLPITRSLTSLLESERVLSAYTKMYVAGVIRFAIGDAVSGEKEVHLLPLNLS